MGEDDWTKLGLACLIATSAENAENTSKAISEIRVLQSEVQGLMTDIEDTKREQQFQMAVEEFIFQFDKKIRYLAQVPTNPLEAFIGIGEFFTEIQRHNLTTSRISGFRNKQIFENTMSAAMELVEELVKIEQVQSYVQKRLEEKRLLEEQQRIEQERAQEEQRIFKERFDAAMIDFDNKFKKFSTKVKKFTALITFIILVWVAYSEPNMRLSVGVLFFIWFIIRLWREIKKQVQNAKSP